MENNVVNVLFDKWHGYEPIYWEKNGIDYFTYYNIHHSKYPEKYLGYRVLQKLKKTSGEYKINNQYYYNDQPMEEEDFKRNIPLYHYICRPIQYRDLFVYRIHLPIAPSSSFFNSLNHGYYIRNIGSSYKSKSYYDPFTFAILKDEHYIYIDEKQCISQKIDEKVYPYVARDFLIEHKHIQTFMDNMKEKGWILEKPILSQKDIYWELQERNRKIKALTGLFDSETIKKKYLYKIFQCVYKEQLQRLQGELYLEITDIRNAFILIWDEALELKNMYRKFGPLKESPEISLEDIQSLYGLINENALDETSEKHKILNELIQIIEWKRQYIDNVSDFNLLKDWILTAMEPMYIFASQLEIKDTTNHYSTHDFVKQLTFCDDKYKVCFDERIQVSPLQNTGDKTPQEQLKILLKNYKNKPEVYTRRRIQKQIEEYRIMLKMIQEMKSLYIGTHEEKEEK